MEIFNVPDDDPELIWTMQPYSGTPLSDKEKKTVEHLYVSLKSVTKAEEDASAAQEEQAATVDASSSPQGALQEALTTLFSKVKNEDIDEDTFVGNLPALQYPNMSKKELKKFNSFAKVVKTIKEEH